MALKTIYEKLPKPVVYRTPRSDLRKHIIEYYLSRDESDIGISPFNLQGGKLQLAYAGAFRSDVLCLQYYGIANVFLFGPQDSEVTIETWLKASIDCEDREKIQEDVTSVRAEYIDYLTQEREFCIWLRANAYKFHCKTPKWAIDYLDEEGWS